MGYYATGGGDINLASPLPRESGSLDLLELLRDWYDHVSLSNDRDVVHLFYDSKYYSGALDSLNDFASQVEIESGEIYYHGEDGELWRLVYNSDLGYFEEQKGNVYYGMELTWDSVPEFVGQILDGFEDFLESRKIDIPNPEKVDSDNPAILYGTDYGELQSYIEETLINWGLLDEPRRKK